MKGSEERMSKLVGKALDMGETKKEYVKSAEKERNEFFSGVFGQK